MTSQTTKRVHGTCIGWERRAALLVGPSASGKSDLGLRFIYQICDGQAGNAAQLIADDQVILSRKHDKIIARPPKTIAGKMEVRGLGIIEFPHLQQAELKLIVDLSEPENISRLPSRPLPCRDYLGILVPVIKLAPFEASATIKLYLALDRHT